MNKNILFIVSILFTSILLSGLVPAQEVTDVVVTKIKQGDPYILAFPCEQQGALCPASTTTCSATAFYQDQTVFFNNITATSNGTFYNITRTGVLPLGVYRNELTCNNGSDNGFDTVWIKVTPTGDSRGWALPGILGIIGFLMLGIGMITKNAWFGVIAGLMFMFTGAYVVIYGFNDLADDFTRGAGWAFVGIGLFFTIVGAYEKALDYSEGDEGDE